MHEPFQERASLATRVPHVIVPPPLTVGVCMHTLSGLNVFPVPPVGALLVSGGNHALLFVFV